MTEQIDNEVREKIESDIHAIVSKSCRLCDYWDNENYHCMLNIPKHPAYSCYLTDRLYSLIQPLIEQAQEDIKYRDQVIACYETRLEQAKQEVARDIITLADKRFEIRDRYANYKAEWVELHKTTEEWRELKSRYLGGGE